MNGRQRNATNAQIWGKQNDRIMMATVRHVTAWAEGTKYQADGFLFDGVYILECLPSVFQNLLNINSSAQMSHLKKPIILSISGAFNWMKCKK